MAPVLRTGGDARGAPEPELEADQHRTPEEDNAVNSYHESKGRHSALGVQLTGVA